MKTKEELSALKEEFTTLTQKLAELTEDELLQVTGGDAYDFRASFPKRGILRAPAAGISGPGEGVAWRTGDTRGELTEEQRSPEYIHQQIFGKKFDESFGR